MERYITRSYNFDNVLCEAISCDLVLDHTDSEIDGIDNIVALPIHIK